MARWLHAAGTGALDEEVKPVNAPKSLNAFKSFRPFPADDDAQVRVGLGLPDRVPLSGCGPGEPRPREILPGRAE